jgi:hypothetical protein
LVENRLEILQRRIDIFQYSVKAKRPWAVLRIE